jgi:hypothetical protein
VSKTTDNVLLVPGESGWEIWTAPADGGFTLHTATGLDHAADLRDVPAGDVTMLFPVRSLTAVPMRVTSDDDALFPDLAAMHAERLGLRPDPMAGQLTDVFVIAREDENTALLSVFLRTPVEGDLPARGPKGFDLSARAYPVQGDALAVWKEFGRWVFAVFHQSKLLYCQATAVDAVQPDDSLAREIRLSLIQLGMQGLEVDSPRVLVWTNDPELNTSALRATLRVPVEISERPLPTPPKPLSKLLPADVRAARRAALRRRNITLVASAAALVYLGLLGWFGYGVWKISDKTQKIIAEAQEAAPDADAYRTHIEKWQELAPIIQIQNCPVDILYRVANCIPPNSGLRLKTADISATEVKITGEAPQLQASNTFSLKLTKNNELSQFKWDTPPANQTKLGWEFVFTGEVPVQETQP